MFLFLFLFLFRRSIPLSVQQALSCRPYLENISKPNTSLSVSKVSSDTNKTVKHYPSNSLIPRVIISKEYRRKHSTNSEALPQVSKSTAPISVGELKRLAYSLGPKQGPSLPPTQDQRENNIDRTRLVNDFYYDCKLQKVTLRKEIKKLCYCCFRVTSCTFTKRNQFYLFLLISSVNITIHNTSWSHIKCLDDRHVFLYIDRNALHI